MIIALNSNQSELPTHGRSWGWRPTVKKTMGHGEGQTCREAGVRRDWGGCCRTSSVKIEKFIEINLFANEKINIFAK